MLKHTSTVLDTQSFPPIVALSSISDPHTISQKKANKLILSIIFITIGLLCILLFLLGATHLKTGQSPHVAIALLLAAIPESLLITLPVLVIVSVYKLRSLGVSIGSTQAIDAISTVDTVIVTERDTLLERPTIAGLWYLEQTAENSHLSMAKTINYVEKSLATDIDRAIVNYVENQKISLPSQTPLTQFFFDAELGISGTLWHQGSGYELYLKGSPEQLLTRCDLTENEREYIERTIHSFAAKNHHSLALAHLSITHPITKLEKLRQTQRMQFDGLIAIDQTIKPQTRATISLAKLHGIAVKVISGSHIESARQFSKQLGIVSSQSGVVDSRHLPYTPSNETQAIARSASVVANTSPRNKSSALSVLSGDSVRIPTTNDLTSTVRAIILSRQLFGNIHQILIYLTSISLIDVIILFESIIGGLEIPFLSVQTLWINVIISTSIILTIGLSDNESYISPKQTHPIISGKLLGRIAIIVIATTGLLLSVYAIFDTLLGRSFAQTIALDIISPIQWLVAYYVAAMSSTPDKRHLRLPFLFGCTATFLAQLFIFPSNISSTILHTAPISLWIATATLILCASIFVFLMEAHKRIYLTKSNKD